MSNVSVPDDIEQLWAEVDTIWEEKQNRDDFESYASADFAAVFNALRELRPHNQSFLELGSGLGVVTIMASRLGFDAYGIEAKTELIDYSRSFAAQLAPTAKFGRGSFIPNQFDWDPANGDESVRTFIDLPDAYGEIEMNLNDFDVIYAYPWPTEHELYNNFLSQYARAGSTFLCYDAREGMQISVI